MSDHPIDVLADRLAVHLPPNWERAHGYRGREPFIAIWWAESGDALHIDDGRYRITASGPFAFDDLIRRVTTTCDEVSPAALGYTGETVSHCLLADLAERTVHYAPLDDALTWLTQRLPAPDEGPTPSAAPPDGQSACLDCQGRGWVRAGERPAAGYTRCLSCDGSGSVSAQVADLQRIRDALIAHHGRALPDITLDAAPLLGRAEDASDGQPVNAALLLHAVAQTSNLNHQEIRAALGARAVAPVTPGQRYLPGYEPSI
jgi:hypothetical protein